jgi:hypothetical protein
MTATPLESTILAAVSYDQARQVLRLEFRSRAVYGYFDVPPEVYQNLMAANSKGSYFNRNIRGRFPHRKLAG